VSLRLCCGRRYGPRLASRLRARWRAELKSFGHEGSSSRLSGEQESALSDWVDTHCPRSIREILAFLKRTFGQSYSRSGLIDLLHRLDFDYRKPEAMPRGLDYARQQAVIDQYEPRSFALRQARETCVPDSPQVLCPQLALVRNQPLDLSGWCGLVGRIGDKASNRSRIRATEHAHRIRSQTWESPPRTRFSCFLTGP
jgi:transposase